MGNRPIDRYLAWLPTSFYDLMAAIVMMGGIGLMAFGIDGEVKTFTAMGAGYLFSSGVKNSKRGGQA